MTGKIASLRLGPARAAGSPMTEWAWEPGEKIFYLEGGLVPESGYNGYNGYKGKKWLENAEKRAKNGQKDAKTGVLRRNLVKWCNRSIY
ncbi:MAG: hypothetical protein R6V73_12980 [Anaerolineales bacterium]